MKALVLGMLAFLISFAAIGYSSETVKQKRVIILLGPPGSGKGTQAKVITEQLGIPHISTGDLFRENMSKRTAIGERARSYMDAGKLVPDDVVIDMLKDRVARADCANGYLLDGFPRTIPQAQALNTILDVNVKLIVINLQVPDDIIIKRIEGRMTCSDCGALYNTYFSPSRVANICDNCKGELIHRADDNAEVVKERLRVYHSQTAPLQEYYTNRGVLYNINGDRDSSTIRTELLQILNH